MLYFPQLENKVYFERREFLKNKITEEELWEELEVESFGGGLLSKLN